VLLALLVVFEFSCWALRLSGWCLGPAEPFADPRLLVTINRRYGTPAVPPSTCPILCYITLIFR